MSRHLDQRVQGASRREWKKLAVYSGSNPIIRIKSEFYEMALASIQSGLPWRDTYACGRISNLSENGRSLLPQLP